MCLNGTAPFNNPNSSSELYNRWYSAHYVALTVAVLSMFGSLFLIASFLLSKDLRRVTSRQILVYISIADFVSCLSNSTGTIHYFNPDGIGCEIQALFTTVSSLSFLIWTTCLAVYIYISIVLDRVPTAKKLMPVFHACGWLLPVAIGAIAYLLGGLGNSLTLATDGWCWIAVSPKHPSNWSCKSAYTLWIVITMKGWEVAIYLIVPALYFRTKYHIYMYMTERRQPISHGMNTALKSVDKKLLIVPIAFVLMRVWGTVRTFNFIINRFDESVHEAPSTTHGLAVLNYLQALGDNGQGFFNFILFALMTKTMRKVIGNFLELCRRKLCCCCACCDGVKRRYQIWKEARQRQRDDAQPTMNYRNAPPGALMPGSGKTSLTATERASLVAQGLLSSKHSSADETTRLIQQGDNLQG